jgi:hypothetical protein
LQKKTLKPPFFSFSGFWRLCLNNRPFPLKIDIRNNPYTIDTINEILSRQRPVEIRVQKGDLVVMEVKKDYKSREPIAD